MKQIKTLLLAVVTFIGAVSFVNAQSKVAHIDTQKLIVRTIDVKKLEN